MKHLDFDFLHSCGRQRPALPSLTALRCRLVGPLGVSIEMTVRMRVVMAPADDSRSRRFGGGPGFAGPQRYDRVTTLVGQDRADIACQLGITVFETAASLPLSLETGDVLVVAAVRALPGLGHPGLRHAGIGSSAHGEP
jgi:hypothetical protein